MANKKNIYTDLMLDLETLSTDVDAVILSIAAVPFNIEGKFVKGTHTVDISPELLRFNIAISVDSCLKHGLIIQEATLLWWLEQSKEAIAAAFLSKQKYSLQLGLKAFSDYLGSFGSIKIWGNGVRFDLGVLAQAYKAAGLPLPWNYRQERDLRTLVGLLPDAKKHTIFKGVQHNPIDDCIHQINYCTETYNLLKG